MEDCAKKNVGFIKLSKENEILIFLQKRILHESHFGSYFRNVDFVFKIQTTGACYFEGVFLKNKIV